MSHCLFLSLSTQPMIQFKHPEVLWALALLFIPIIIHLFHLRRFKKTPFTNVALLKTIKITTRKSSQLKRWLILLTRLGMLSCLVLAFAQPFIPNSNEFNKPVELIVFLDNSFSMQAKGANGSLLNEAKQQLINYLPEEGNFTLLTNDRSYENVSRSTLQKDLIDLSYSNNQLTYDAALLKASQYFSKNGDTSKSLVMISDFQDNFSGSIATNEESVTGLIILRPQNTNNVALDSLYFKDDSENKVLVANLSNYGDPIDNMAISLYNNKELVTKVSTDIVDKAEVEFNIDYLENFKGKLDILDNGLSFDNRLYFSINKKENINVLAINGSEDFYLKKIYTPDEFTYSGFELSNLPYNQISDQNLVVLNHLEVIPDVLINTLSKFYTDGGSVLVIPSNNADLTSYNSLLQQIDQPLLTSMQTESKKMTDVSFEHPLIKEAFYSKVTNFQYPTFQSSFSRNSKRNAVYSLEDGTSLLVGSNRAYSFSADITSDNSDFLSSPFVVTALYNMAKLSLRSAELYYHIGPVNSIVLNEKLNSEDIITLNQGDYSTIPRQRAYGKYVEIITMEEPETDGHYDLNFKGINLRNLSYNYPRNESRLVYTLPEETDRLHVWSNLEEAMSDIKSATEVKALWKWFAIFALVLLLLEMLILKYFK